MAMREWERNGDWEWQREEAGQEAAAAAAAVVAVVVATTRCATKLNRINL